MSNEAFGLGVGQISFAGAPFLGLVEKGKPKGSLGIHSFWRVSRLSPRRKLLPSGGGRADREVSQPERPLEKDVGLNVRRVLSLGLRISSS